MSARNTEKVEGKIRGLFGAARIMIDALEVRDYPDETIVIVRVPSTQYEEAVVSVSKLDSELAGLDFQGFVTVRKTDEATSRRDDPQTLGVGDPRAVELANLCAGRSRTSEVQPSLAYMRDAANSLDGVLASRNHLVFGRRGAGKTALLVEAKRTLDSGNDATAWINIQTIRAEGVLRAYLWAARRVVDALLVRLKHSTSRFVSDVFDLGEEIQTLLSKKDTDPSSARRLVPKLQRVIARSLSILGCRLFLFLDDLHYLDRNDQPLLLDLLHGSFRDSDAWLKVTAIRHLAKWFQATPPLGLQSGHDATHIDLDFTLESPSEAKQFLDRVLDTFATHSGLRRSRALFSEDALDRLVLASGAVPRDYLELAAASIKEARKRPKARLVGVQDVNRAAGEQSKVKIQELEDDAAAGMSGGAKRLIDALNKVRAFCLDEKHYTFFRVDFRDKENHPSEYALVAGLLDVKIVHMVASSLSDMHAAGRRGEVYMLDLSQFSGQRLKKNLWVLDFVKGHLMLKKTTSQVAAKPGDTPRRLQELLRRGPTLALELFTVRPASRRGTRHHA